MSSLRRGDRGGAVTEIRAALAALGLVDNPDADLTTGKHVALDAFDLSDEEIYRRGIAELSAWYPDADFRPLAVYRIPYCQFAQPPGVHAELPGNRTETPGLFLAGEYTEDSSINGSMLSGEKVAMEAMRR